MIHMGNLEDNLKFLAENPNWKPPKIYPQWWVFTLGRKGEKTNFIGRLTAKNKKEALKIAIAKYGKIWGLKVEKLSPEDQKMAQELSWKWKV